jgi:hypothetical protein
MCAVTPAARVGKTANVVIFLGILYTILALVAFMHTHETTPAWYDMVGLVVAIVTIGLGYGIRYGNLGCLYATTGLFVVLTGYFFYAAVSYRTLRPMIRFLLGAWAVYMLYRSIPAMHFLKQTHATPLQTSRYGAFFLGRRQRR